MYMILFMFMLFMSICMFIFSLFMIYNNKVIFLEWELFSFNSFELIYLIMLDWMSLFFMSFVMMISSLVILYSKSYMSSDNYKIRFILLILLFVMSMMFMIMSPNLVSILLGWDGLGLISFCLVVYYQNNKSYNAGMITILSNRVGDIGILLSIAWMLNFGSWNFLLYLYFMKNNMFYYIIGSLILLAGVTKSAQIPFSAWLPAAMAAPTPVSSLVHSSTLVTAGVYLLIRFFDFFSYSKMFQWFLLISLLTMLMSGVSANFEFDLKKIIALSTLSQLGLMMSILSLNFKNLAFFHLLTHAFFKALLFLCAGVLIHNLSNFQDIRFMGSLSLMMPMTLSCFLIANLALCGFPFLSGFYSKDLILEIMSMNSINIFIYILFYFCMGLTVSYTVRLMWYLIFTEKNFLNLSNFNDEDYTMTKNLLFLSLLSVFMGSMLLWLMFNNLNYIYLSFFMKEFIYLNMILGFMMGVGIALKFKFSKFMVKKYFFFNYMWFLNLLLTYGLTFNFLKIGKIYMKMMDLGWLEHLLKNNFYQNIFYSMNILQFLQKNTIKIFLMFFMIWYIMIFMFIM
uniref:NADH-ubiquinone oxidoreductase chain 5 n=1 Tax=Anisocentropus maculatus TaxID=2904904 RepID=A0A9E8LPG9_9NEOP|nr:NADH dehydrogenase subunit 5 [Anisocentropus maculatus]UZZ43760.1 NADH dehydrogenase subunit 5 [Anisocentropus maculatus]